MWFVLPQVAGLGRSATARRYAICGIDEARDYFAHPVLGPRLVECAQTLTLKGLIHHGGLRADIPTGGGATAGMTIRAPT